LKRLAAVFTLILLLTTSVTGGYFVVLCSKPVCAPEKAQSCSSSARAECRTCYPAKTACSEQKTCCEQEARSEQTACPIQKSESKPDQTRVVLVLMLAVESCDMQRCSGISSGPVLGDYREQQPPAQPDPGLILCAAPIDLTAESPPSVDIHASLQAGVHPQLQTVVLRC
jgi:hypothetical protein